MKQLAFFEQFTTSIKVVAADLDGSKPNNILSVTFDACPLESDSANYEAVEGNSVDITFHLTTQLDYDSQQHEITCTGVISVSTGYYNIETVDKDLYISIVKLLGFPLLHLQDGGSPSLSTEITIAIIVAPFSDEMPKFEHPLYSSQLDSLEVVRINYEFNLPTIDIIPTLFFR